MTMLGRVMGLVYLGGYADLATGDLVFGWITQTLGEANGLLGIGGVLLLVGESACYFRPA